VERPARLTALASARPRFGWHFQTGDKVIQTENDYDKDVFNGDVGIVERIDGVEQLVTVRFDERLVKYDFGELDEISLAYEITIHKWQGAEFPAVVIPLATQHYIRHRPRRVSRRRLPNAIRYAFLRLRPCS